MLIAITGTPGTGKSSLASEISLLLHMPVLDVNKLIKERHLAEGFDAKRGCCIVNPSKLVKELLKVRKTAKKGIIVDSHLSHFLPSQAVGLCIVTKCGLKALQKRLVTRGYSAAKVRENLDSEIFDICLNEAIEAGHNIAVVDTTRTSAKMLAKSIAKQLKKC